MDIEKELARVLDSGKIRVGIKEAMRTQEAKMLIISNNCPTKKKIMQAAGTTPVYVYRGNNVALGAACGKPFSVSVVSIIDEGKSNILKLGETK